MRVLITGSRGFVGSCLAATLRHEGHHVRTTDLIGDLADPLHVALRLDDDAGWTELVRAFQPEAVVHLAGLTSAPNPLELYAVNVMGTERVLKAIECASTQPPVVILTSTASVYGHSPDPIPESAPLRPPTHYGLSKLAMEYLGAQFSDRLPIWVIRPFNLIGKGQREAFLVPKLVRHFVDRAPHIELGNIKPERDFLDVRDACAAIAELIHLRPPTLEVLNVSRGEGTSVEALFEFLVELTGHRPAIKVNPAFVRANDPQRVVGANDALKKRVAHFAPRSLRDTLAWMAGRERSAPPE